MTHDLIAKKCGIVKEDEVFDKLTLQQYLDLYNQPLNDSSTDAILNLTKVAVEKEKKKKKQKKAKKTQVPESLQDQAPEAPEEEDGRTEAMVTSVNSDIVCIQETKLVVISPSIVRNSLGSSFQNNHVYLLAAGTKGDSNSS
jgi:hypothetical protein